MGNNRLYKTYFYIYLIYIYASSKIGVLRNSKKAAGRVSLTHLEAPSGSGTSEGGSLRVFLFCWEESIFKSNSFLEQLNKGLSFWWLGVWGWIWLWSFVVMSRLQMMILELSIDKERVSVIWAPKEFIWMVAQCTCCPRSTFENISSNDFLEGHAIIPSVTQTVRAPWSSGLGLRLLQVDMSIQLISWPFVSLINEHRLISFWYFSLSYIGTLKWVLSTTWEKKRVGTWNDFRNKWFNQFNTRQKTIRTAMKGFGCMASVKAKLLHCQYCMQLRTKTANFQTIMVKHSQARLKLSFALLASVFPFVWTKTLNCCWNSRISGSTIEHGNWRYIFYNHTVHCETWYLETLPTQLPISSASIGTGSEIPQLAQRTPSSHHPGLQL